MNLDEFGDVGDVIKANFLDDEISAGHGLIESLSYLNSTLEISNWQKSPISQKTTKLVY